MTKLEQAARQALDALEVHQPDPEQQMVTEAIIALREALAEQAECPHGVDDGACKECYMEQAEQRRGSEHMEPVAWRVRGYSQFKTGNPAPWRYVDGAYKPSVNNPDCCDFTPLYTRPVRTKDLTDDEIYPLYNEPSYDREAIEFARAVIQEFRRKNGIV